MLRLVLSAVLLLPLGAHAGLRANVTLFATKTGLPGLFGAGGALLVEGEKELPLGVTVFGAAPLSLSWNGTTVDFADLGIRLGLRWTPRGWLEGEGLTLELFANNAGRVRPTFDWANRWGLARTMRVSPMAQLAFARSGFEVWGAVQARSGIDQLTTDEEVQASTFFGASLRLPAGFTLSGRGAVVDWGYSPGLGSQGIRLPIVAGGGSGQLRWDFDQPVGPMLELFTYAGDPARFERFFYDESQREPFAASIAIEAGAMTQSLEDPDAFAVGQQVTTGYFDAQARVRGGPARFFLTVRVRPVDAIVFDGPGLPPFKAWPSGTTTGDEVSFLLGADLAIRSLGLVPGVSVKLLRPAFVFSPGQILGGNNPPPGFGGGRVMVVKSPTLITLFPEGQGVRPVWLTTFNLRFNLRSTLFVAFELQWEHDPNRIIWRDDAAGVAQPTSDASLFNTVNLLLAIQARF